MPWSARERSVVFNYSADAGAYRAFVSESILISTGRPVDAYPKRLGEFLAEDFLECSVGRLDLWYDWEKALTFELPLGARLTTKFLSAIQVVGSRATLDNG